MLAAAYTRRTRPPRSADERAARPLVAKGERYRASGLRHNQPDDIPRRLGRHGMKRDASPSAHGWRRRDHRSQRAGVGKPCGQRWSAWNAQGGCRHRRPRLGTRPPDRDRQRRGVPLPDEFDFAAGACPRRSGDDGTARGARRWIGRWPDDPGQRRGRRGRALRVADPRLPAGRAGSALSAARAAAPTRYGGAFARSTASARMWRAGDGADRR